MSKIAFIKNEIIAVKKQTDALLDTIKKDDWFTTPNIIESNINWQIGHIFLANYLHGIVSITGSNEEIKKHFDVKDFIKFYGMGSNPKNFIDEKPSNKEIFNLYELLFPFIFKALETITDNDLDTEVVYPNPGAKTKVEALTMLFKHQSWHNGQIAILKRVLNQ